MLDKRNAFINEMNNIFTSHKKKFHNILQQLGWTPQSVAGHAKEEENSSAPSENVEYSQGRETVDSINNVKNESEGTSRDTERYNDLLASLSFQPKAKQEKVSSTKLLASLLESERNAKRRRISYRNKVHTKNKSHTEVLREVIHEQMEVLRNTEDSTEIKKIKGDKTKEKDDESMLEVKVTDGNPHLAWQTVGIFIKQHDERESYDKSSRHERNTNYHRDRTINDQRTYHHHRGHSPKRRSKSPHRQRDYSPDYRHSSQSSSSKSKKRHSSKSRSQTSSSSHRSKHHSKHKRDR